MIRRPPRSTRTDTLFPYTTLFRSACSLGNWVLRLTLGSDEQHLAAMRHCLRHEIQRAREKRHGLGQVKNMDAIPLAEDVWLHARIPAVCLVAEMRAGLNQLLHGDDRRSEERRVGKECVSTCRFRWVPDH